MPGDFVATLRFIEALPEFDVFHRLSVGGCPAAFLPIVNPARNAAAQILRIGMQIDVAGPAQSFQRRNGGQQFHAIIRRQLFAARQFALVRIIDQNRTPAAGTGISRTCAIGPDLDAFAHALQP